jgi:hypothetical protein
MLGEEGASGDASRAVAVLVALGLELKAVLVHLGGGSGTQDVLGGTVREGDELLDRGVVLIDGIEQCGGCDVHIGTGGLGVLPCLGGIEGLPVSNVLSYATDDGCKAIVRPSGTEPKVKVYLSAKAENREAADKLLKDMTQQMTALILG